MRKFSLFIIRDGEEMFVGEGLYDNEEQALDDAEQEAIGAYTFSPNRDILDIMEQEGIDDEEVAFEIFKSEAKNVVKCFVMENPTNENGNRLHRYER